MFWGQDMRPLPPCCALLLCCVCLSVPSSSISYAKLKASLHGKGSKLVHTTITTSVGRLQESNSSTQFWNQVLLRTVKGIETTSLMTPPGPKSPTTTLFCTTSTCCALNSTAVNSTAVNSTADLNMLWECTPWKAYGHYYLTSAGPASTGAEKCAEMTLLKSQSCVMALIHLRVGPGHLAKQRVWMTGMTISLPPIMGNVTGSRRCSGEK